MEKWILPVTAEIGGVIYNINTDYRDVLEIFSYLNDVEDELTARVISMALFYDDFEQMPLDDYNEAADYLFEFIRAGDVPGDTTGRKLIDWDHDYPVIAAEVNKAAGREIRALPYLHWFTFIGHFNSIGEGQLSSIVSIRSKKSKGKKLEKWEQDFYQENKAKIDFVKKYSVEEQAEIDRLKAILGE